MLLVSTIRFVTPLILSRGNMVDAFQTLIMQMKELSTCPVRQIGRRFFFYMRISNIYIVIVVSSNANVGCTFKFVVEAVEWKIHRALVNRELERKSLVYFVCPREDKTLKPPQNLCGSDEERKYPDFT